MAVIKMLPANLINQIAAGEVVERPASVVKELVENSLDAQATQIEVRLQRAGRELISVTDNGCGMDAQDARMSLKRHATSKINSFDDLMNIGTLGFRGEALPSIASISHLTLQTRAENAELSHEIRIEGGKLLGEHSSNFPKGTQIRVEHLFYNVPARRKFLKSDPTELKNCVDTVRAIAMGNPEVAFKLLEGKRLLIDMPAKQTMQDRLECLWGQDVMEGLREISLKEGEWMLSGAASPIAKMFSSREKISFFVNRRPVDGKVFHSALRETYGASLGRGHYPAAFVFLEIPASEVDVNVHPAKREVRFRQEREVYSFLVKGLSKALAINPTVSPQMLGITPFPFPAALQTPNGLPTFAPPPKTALPSNYPQTTALPFESLRKETGPQNISPSQTLIKLSENSENRHGWRFLEFAHKDYAIFSTPEGIAILSIQNARERVAYDLMEAAFGQAQAQALLVPALLKLEPHMEETLQAHMDFFLKQGFLISPFGKGCCRVEGIPSWLKPENGFHGSPESLLLREIAALHEGEFSASQEGLKHSAIARAIARYPGVPLRQPSAAIRLLNDLLSGKHPLKSPSGEATLWMISNEELMKKFK